MTIRKSKIFSTALQPRWALPHVLLSPHLRPTQQPDLRTNHPIRKMLNLPLVPGSIPWLLKLIYTLVAPIWGGTFVSGFILLRRAKHDHPNTMKRLDWVLARMLVGTRTIRYDFRLAFWDVTANSCLVKYAYTANKQPPRSSVRDVYLF
ncbi:hypothetical protein P691DRAFT_506573 [Macrolepiota fuliginosa MF-IS2]|uniref:Uncharacterized protein n=1 Tax=Macrolepiota fuliginosa MF-IS2 TaxID=1400762 RepID=A0A9P5X2L3_9AGAR|nr:hypothetical protein P691DRAFT_506573 [Macrolepiota fuliginosa MF-IS2]